MQDLRPIIWEAVSTGAAKGEVIDVDAYCQRFAAMRPDLSRRDIQDAVLKAVAMLGGGASWSDGKNKMPDPGC